MNALISASGAARKPALALAASVVLLSGCASTGNPGDPLEGYNRAMFGFNEQLDKVVVKPAAQAYEFVLPSFVRSGVGNFIGNLEDPWIGLNNLLQGKVADGLTDMMRFAFNSNIHFTFNDKQYGFCFSIQFRLLRAAIWCDFDDIL